jgi:hypothetical protein
VQQLNLLAHVRATFPAPLYTCEQLDANGRHSAAQQKVEQDKQAATECKTLSYQQMMARHAATNL